MSEFPETASFELPRKPRGRPRGSRNKPKLCGDSSATVDPSGHIRNPNDPTPRQMAKGDALGRRQFCVDEIWKLLKFGRATTREVVRELVRRQLTPQEAIWGLKFMEKRGRIMQVEIDEWQRV